MTSEEPSTAVSEKAHHPPLAPGLYLVATPIGNLEDITLRALRVLRSVDRIACEDTRQTAKLLHHFGIQTPTVSYHLHNETGRAQQLLDELKSGARIAIVSDAGTPGIADPGVAIVSAAIAANIAVYPVPGANAALSALIAGGLSTERFTFHGFLPAKAGQRRTLLEMAHEALRSHLPTAASPEDAPTQIFYETPHRILDALSDIAAIFGPAHRTVLARELTKLHEEFLRGPVSEVLATLRTRETIRGEIVLLLDGAITTGNAAQPSIHSLTDEVSAHIRSGLSEKDALKRAAKARGLAKSEAYREWQRTKR